MVTRDVSSQFKGISTKVGWWFLVAVATAAAHAAEFVPSTVRPPEVQREFRGVWVASVKNIDWPSKPGLSAAQQKAELVRILDQCVQLHLNAIFLQVRPACDALYQSAIEPWSEYLTGTMGRSPGYDPLAFAVEEAHRRGLELHAWINPFRARHSSSTSAISGMHISRTQPALVKSYGKSLWLDPGERAVHDYSVRVILDVVQRYDIDGIHFDDYFYPYDEKDSKGRALPFPDEPSYKRYQAGGGRLNREDWRRDNVNTFIRRVEGAVHGGKPWVKFGISPFGIWRPGHPASVKGLDAYDKLYGDSRLWLADAWVDYLAPQLYWATSAPEQSFPALLQWWSEQNLHHRHLWPGLAHRLGSEEITRQIRTTRKQGGATGEIHWSMKSLLNDSVLGREVYEHPALSPAFPWLDSTPPPVPKLTVTAGQHSEARANWTAAAGEAVWLWVLQTRSKGTWSAEILPRNQTSRVLKEIDVVGLTAVDRCGNASATVMLEKRPGP